MQKILIIYLVCINLILFITMGADKLAAKRHKHRVPEATLLTLAVIGGSVGGILGMLLFRHKTRHVKFYIGYPVILLCQIALVLLVYLVFFK